MKEQRLALAREHVNWGVEDWRRVTFPDESHFELRFGSQETCCRKPRGSDSFAPGFTRKTVKHLQKLMVWDRFSCRCRGGQEFLKTGEIMNGSGTASCLMISLNSSCLHSTSHFLQDGAPCLRCKVVLAWLQQRPHNQLVKWSGSSPDLNPSRMKKKLISWNLTKRIIFKKCAFFGGYCNIGCCLLSKYVLKGTIRSD